MEKDFECTAEQLTQSFVQEATSELLQSKRKIIHCLDQLDENQIWWRPADDMNSIANLILHLCGNLQQWLVAGLTDHGDTRDRPGEFSVRAGLDKAELLQRLDDTVSAVRESLLAVPANKLLQRRRIQEFDVSGTQAIFESVAHFRGHCQEIVHMTRIQLGTSYSFDFVPQEA